MKELGYNLSEVTAEMLGRAKSVKVTKDNTTIVDQDEIPGTGRAVEVGLNALDAQASVSGTVLVTYGDQAQAAPQYQQQPYGAQNPYDQGAYGAQQGAWP